MNRQQRRAAGRRWRMTRDGRRVTATGDMATGTRHADMAAVLEHRPEGEHLWVAFVGYRVSDAEASGEASAMLSLERIVSGPDVGCLACEQAYLAAHDSPCPGQPPGRLEYVGGEHG